MEIHAQQQREQPAAPLHAEHRGRGSAGLARAVGGAGTEALQRAASRANAGPHAAQLVAIRSLLARRPEGGRPLAAQRSHDGSSAGTTGEPVVQRVELYRFGTRGRPFTFQPQNPVPDGVSLEDFCRVILEKAGFPVEAMTFEDVGENEQATLVAAEMHAQEALGDKNKLSPFLSLTTSWGDAAKAGTIGGIVGSAQSIFTFDVPDERVVKVGNGVSFGESEILVWLRKGESLEGDVTDEMPNIFRAGKTLNDRFVPGGTI